MMTTVLKWLYISHHLCLYILTQQGLISEIIVLKMITIVSFILLLLMVATLLKRGKSASKSSKHDLESVPGPKKLPLIGNLHLLVSNSPPHHIFRDLAAKYGPLMRLQLGQVPHLFVSSVEVANQVLKTHDVAFANRPTILVAKAFTYNCTDIGLAPYGEYWRQLRKICTLELLSARRVRCFRPIREEENVNVVRWIASRAGSPANLSERIYLSSFDITSRASIGKEAEEKQTLTSAIKEIMKMGSGFSISDLYPSNTLLPVVTGLNFKVQRIFRQTDKTLESIINQHRVSNAIERSEDLADVLLNYQKDDGGVRLTTDNIKAVILVGVHVSSSILCEHNNTFLPC